MIKQILFKIFIQLRYLKKNLKYFVNKKINKSVCFKEHIIQKMRQRAIFNASLKWREFRTEDEDGEQRAPSLGVIKKNLSI